MMHNDDRQPWGGQAAYGLPLDRISPRPHLHAMGEEATSLWELAEDIRLHGLRRPVTVRRQGSGRYVIVSGNRRLLACRMLGMTHMDAILLPEEPRWQSAPQLMTALQSGRMHYLEAADALRALNMQHGMSRHMLSQALGMAPQALLARMQLTAMGWELRAYLMDEGVPERMAQALMKLPDDAERLRAARRAVQERLCIRDVELLVASQLSRTRRAEQAPEQAEAAEPAGRVIRLMRDQRPYINAIRDIAGQMKAAGVPATLTERYTGGMLEMTVTLPCRRRRGERRQSSM